MGAGQARCRSWRPIKFAALLVALAPGLWLLGRALDGSLGARPLKAAINDTGDWSIYLLVATLAITPARHILAAPRLPLARRTVGLAAFGYAVLHLGLYALDFDFALTRVAGEIATRTYLTIGTFALAGLAPLAATSWDGAMRRLGGVHWNRLHLLVHACLLLAVVHFLLRSPTDTSEPMLMAGLLVWLAGFRLLRRWSNVRPETLALLAIASAAITAFGEAAWHAVATGIDPWRILHANLETGSGLRPAWWVLIAGLTATALGAAAHRSHDSNARASASSAVSGASRGQSPS
jgi:sulfoxide reductase heme-binding subunit YedZ